MSALLKLAERVEAATGPSAHLDAQIHILIDPNAQHIVGHEPGRFPQKAIYGPRSTFWEWACDETTEPPAFATIPRYTASIDSAMTLAISGVSAADVLRHAVKRCSRYGTPTFIEALPRFVASEWLRAHASGETE